MQRSHPHSSASPEPPGALSDSEDLEDMELETLAALHNADFNYEDLIPPAVPLMPKAVLPREPLRPAYNDPLLTLPEFEGLEALQPQGDEVNKAAFPEQYPAEMTIRKLFQEDIIYRRTPIAKFLKNSTRAGFFNARFCDVKKLLLQVHSEERHNFEGTFSPLLCPSLPPFYTPRDPQDPTLVFESRFESGNLELVARVSDTEYNLLLQNDINSKGHTQWFFFKVVNMRTGVRYKFNIVNFVKPDSLFNHGMQSLVYSIKGNKERGQGWQRGGSDYLYYSNGLMRENSEKRHYSLSFTYQFPYRDDEVYFAYSFPYTYSQLVSYLDKIEGDEDCQKFLTRKTLCRTLAGNKCEYLTITNTGTSEQIRRKKGIVITGRVHPGETVGSWMMQGVMDFLTGNSPEAHAVRDQFVFKIIPMLNPDGVINGNYRCSLIGADMNRRWKKPHKIIHPVIYNAKRLIKSFASNFKLELICDLHGHSRKKNIFMYGCNIKEEPHICKLFPYMLSKASAVFHFPYCKFNVSKSKEATMRVALFKETRMPCIYTLESSFLGPDTGKYAGMHFTRSILQDMGRDLCLVLLANFGFAGYIPRSLGATAPSTGKKAVTSTGVQSQRTDSYGVESGTVEMFQTLAGLNRGNLLKELMKDQELLHQGEDEDSSGSDSGPSDDNLEPSELAQFVPAIQKNSAPARGKKPLSKTSSRTIIKPANTISRPMPRPKAKKCPDCGKDLLMNHRCLAKPAPAEKQTKPASAFVQKRPVIGVKTYYNLVGKRVHDQMTQTPASFYLNYKLTKQREKEARTTRAPLIGTLSSNMPFNAQLLDLQPATPPDYSRPHTDSIVAIPSDIPLSPTPHSVRESEDNPKPMLMVEGPQLARERISYGSLQAVKRSLYHDRLRHSSANNSIAKPN